MMDATRSGYVIVWCDSCDAPERVWGTTNFTEAIEYVKTLGWTIRKENEEYKHLCPACSQPDFGRVS